MTDHPFKDNPTIRIEEIVLGLEEDEACLPTKIIAILGISPSRLLDFSVVKRAIDSRKKNRICLVYSVNVQITDPTGYLATLEQATNLEHQDLSKRHKVRMQAPYSYISRTVPAGSLQKPPLVVGTGPAGLFAALVLAKAGLNPLVIERGKAVDDRQKDIAIFFASGRLNSQSNIQFGEGGAGTFSDGKLNTLVNNPRIKHIFEEFVEAGAPPEIMTDARPHIGTDKLRVVVKNLRKKIIALGGQVRFNTCLTDLDLKEGRLLSAIVNGGERIETCDLVLAIGHSARDTYEMLHRQNLELKAKPFAIGLRIEHLAERINKAQYGAWFDHPRLPTANYKLVAHLPHLRSVYTFCMCPGGYVIAAASEEKHLVTNGMSAYARNGKNSNSALLVHVGPNDFGSDHPLAGITFQRHWESLAFLAGGGDYNAPVQLVGDFLRRRPSTKFGEVRPSYQPGTKLTELDACLPDYIIQSIREALPVLDRKLKGFAHGDAILTGVESRSSAPVRILRNDVFESSVKGIYPIGEGAGYAGGIVSSALDGLAVGEIIIDKYLSHQSANA